MRSAAVCGGHRCGQRRKTTVRKATAHPLTGQYITTQVHSAYLGPVTIKCMDLGRGNIGLLAPVTALNGRDTIYVQEIDAQLNGLDPDNNTYQLSRLIRAPPTVLNIAECQRNHDVIVALKAKQTPLTPAEDAQLLAALIYNNPVDIHFNTCNYLGFLQQRIRVNSPVTTSNHVVTLHNIPGLDNAYFSGAFMVIGNGSTLFYPLGTTDIDGHELGHAIVQQLCGLIYQGDAGALNESYADVLGVTFEFWLYALKSGLAGVPDWTIGEDNGKRIRFLRNMQDPTNAQMPQPKTLNGPFWKNPNDSEDYGNVHTNSGVANFIFYDFSQKCDVYRALNVWIACLRILPANASYMNFRDCLKKVCPPELAAALQQSLNDAGLTDTANSGWIQPARKRK